MGRSRAVSAPGKALVRLTVQAGNADEANGQVWMADLTGDLLLEGTKTRSATRIAQDAAAMGGEVAVQVAENLTTVGGEVLAEFAPAMVDLVADVVRNSAFPESELARLKANLGRRLSIAKSQSQQMAAEAFRAAMYPGQSYGRLFPADEALQAYKLANAKAFWSGHYGADRSTLYVVGVFDAKTTEAAIRKAFEGWGKATAPAAAAPKASSKRTLTVLDRPGASQSTVVLGMPVVDPSSADYVPLVVTNALLGGSFGSRITSNIREQKGYTYSPFSQVSVRRQGAFWAETADVTTNVTGASIKEIFGEIDRLRAEPPSAAELKGIQNYLAGTFVLQNSSRAGIANSSSSSRSTGCRTRTFPASSRASMASRPRRSRASRRPTSGPTRRPSSWSATARSSTTSSRRTGRPRPPEDGRNQAGVRTTAKDVEQTLTRYAHFEE